MKHSAQKPAAEAVRLWILCAALLVSAAVLAAATFIALRPPAAPAAAGAEGNISEHYTPNEGASQENSASTAGNSENIQNSAPPYAVRAWGERIAVFREGDPVPLHTIDTPLSRLPEADRRLLQKGIPAETLPAALKIIEDYE